VVALWLYGLMNNIGVIILAYVYRLNQTAVRTELVPRRQELEALLMSLRDETPAVSSNPTEY